MEPYMPSIRNIIHADEQLHIGSKYFRYHVRMYVETLLWLQDQISPVGWDTVRNAILEDHLIHARILINFLSKFDAHERKDDVLAIDYFHDIHGAFQLLQDDFLKSQADNIGGYLVHITTKPMPKLKSEQEWFIRETASKLVPALKAFLSAVPETRLVDGAKNECLSYLAKLSLPQIPVSLTAST
jgi:hypothetical protein